MSVERRRLEITDLPGGLEIPYFEVAGSREGPRLSILGGVHGCEYAGMQAVRRFVALVDPGELAGSIIAVPIVNIPAFRERMPFVVPRDGKNLNRTFPGDPNGTYSEVLADIVFEKFVRGADYLIDCHAGDAPESLEPFAMYDESPVSECARGMALAYGLGHVVRLAAQSGSIGGSSSAAAAGAGVPAITAEAGANGLLDAHSVDLHLRGLRNVACHLQMLPGEPHVPAEQVEHNEGWVWMYAPIAGWWDSHVQLGVPVAKDEILGTLSDLYGDVLHEIRAPEPGIPLFVTSSPAVADDGLLLALARGGADVSSTAQVEAR